MSAQLDHDSSDGDDANLVGLRALGEDEPLVDPNADTFELDLGAGRRVVIPMDRSAQRRGVAGASGTEAQSETGAVVWDGAVLHVNRRLRDDPDALRKIRLCFTLCWRWRDWSDTRWLGAGVSGQYFVRSQACAADFVVGIVLADGRTGKYYISGYKKAGPAERRPHAVAALCSVRCRRRCTSAMPSFPRSRQTCC